MFVNLNYVHHHLGIITITLSFIYLLIFHMNGGKIVVPTIFFFLYAIGGYLIMYAMYKKQKKYDVSVLELIGATISLYLGIYLSIMQK